MCEHKESINTICKVISKAMQNKHMWLLIKLRQKEIVAD